jgi:4-amino-4-deoxy-L-arabinose transferase-like glycosyltransferase
MQLSHAPVSKAHVVAICLGLAFWFFGLSRLGYNERLKRKVRTRANITAVLLVLSMIGFVFGFWSMPVTHRLVFGVVFGWTTLTSVELIAKGNAT